MSCLLNQPENFPTDRSNDNGKDGRSDEESSGWSKSVISCLMMPGVDGWCDDMMDDGLGIDGWWGEFMNEDCLCIICAYKLIISINRKDHFSLSI